jgi:copper chaperone CopZ
MKTQRVTIPIDDLSNSGGGVVLVERALARTAGVLHVYVNAATEMAYIVYDPAQSDPDRLIKVIEDTGFRAGRPGLR